MKLENFAKYITYKSFEAELHDIRQKSLERILASESLIDKEVKKKKVTTKKTA